MLYIVVIYFITIQLFSNNLLHNEQWRTLKIWLSGFNDMIPNFILDSLHHFSTTRFHTKLSIHLVDAVSLLYMAVKYCTMLRGMTNVDCASSREIFSMLHVIASKKIASWYLLSLIHTKPFFIEHKHLTVTNYKQKIRQ